MLEYVEKAGCGGLIPDRLIDLINDKESFALMATTKQSVSARSGKPETSNKHDKNSRNNIIVGMY